MLRFSLTASIGCAPHRHGCVPHHGTRRVGLAVAMAAAANLWLMFSTTAQAQTAPLNDTGQTSCYGTTDNSAAANCATVNAALPGQDARFGRDAAQANGQLPAKVGGGSAGFDFTRICWNGKAEGDAQCRGTLVANNADAATSSPNTDWACTRDNVTGLVWSLQSQLATWTAAKASTYPDAGHNSATRCGYSAGWRLPTRRELLSIAHHGRQSPAIDVDYFPSTASTLYWTSDAYAPGQSRAWVVDFNYGYTYAYDRTNSARVRLVRSGQ